MMSSAGWIVSHQSSGWGSTWRVMPSFSKTGTSSSIDRHQASSQASIIEPVWQQ